MAPRQWTFGVQGICKDKDQLFKERPQFSLRQQGLLKKLCPLIDEIAYNRKNKRRQEYECAEPHSQILRRKKELHDAKRGSFLLGEEKDENSESDPGKQNSI